MKRRTFLASAILGSAVIQIGCKQPPDPSSRPPQFSALMGADEFKLLGNRLLTQLGGKDKIRTEWERLDDPSNAVTKDFIDGNIIVAEGWVLSRTEALHCALFTALNPAHAR